MSKVRDVEHHGMGAKLAAASKLIRTEEVSFPPPPIGRTDPEPGEASPFALTNATSNAQAKSFAEEHQLQNTYKMLQMDPMMMTRSTLSTTLDGRAPVYLIRLIIKLSPGVAAPPRQGPSPTQIDPQCLYSRMSSSPRLFPTDHLLTCPFLSVAYFR